MSPLWGHLSIKQQMSRGLCQPVHPEVRARKPEKIAEQASQRQLRDSPAQRSHVEGLLPRQGPNAIRFPTPLLSPEPPASDNNQHSSCQGQHHHTIRLLLPSTQYDYSHFANKKTGLREANDSLKVRLLKSRRTLGLLSSQMPSSPQMLCSQLSSFAGFCPIPITACLRIQRRHEHQGKVRMEHLLEFQVAPGCMGRWRGNSSVGGPGAASHHAPQTRHSTVFIKCCKFITFQTAP